jgi:hypothetical protein
VRWYFTLKAALTTASTTRPPAGIVRYLIGDPWAAINVFSRKDAVDVCREMLRVLTGATIDDLQTFEKASFVFWQRGYKKDYATIADSGPVERRRSLGQVVSKTLATTAI